MNRGCVRLRYLSAAVTALVVLVVSVIGLVPVLPAATAANGSDFQAGNIISDSVFFDGGAMSATSIESFFQSQPCSPRNGVSCLQDYSQTTPNRAADGNCAAYQGAANESAALIIVKVGAACGINPKVLIVLLQKEQTLVTNPSAYGYRSATGWGCPDTAPCDAEYYGFFNQVYKAAWQFQQYTHTPSHWRYHVGTSFVQYSPNAACGGSNINIQNQATANLYIYTPYQPNAAALANMYGVGDGCSAYGNRNFWRIFTDWFGNPAAGPPVGHADEVSAVPSSIRVRGWALDPGSTESNSVLITIDGKSTTTAATLDRPDIGVAFGRGNAHGFDQTFFAGTGNHSVTIYSLSNGFNGPNTLIFSGTATVPDGTPGQPYGRVSSVTVDGSVVHVTGWALDPGNKGPIKVVLEISGQLYVPVVANVQRDDLNGLFPEGSAHGFDATVPLLSGQNTLSVVATTTVAGGQNTVLATQDLGTNGQVTSAPMGAVTEIRQSGAAISLSGWAMQNDRNDALRVRVVVDGNSTTVLANQERVGLNQSYGRGDEHGFQATVSVTPGTHTVQVFADSATDTSKSATLFSRQFTTTG